MPDTNSKLPKVDHVLQWVEERARCRMTKRPRETVWDEVLAAEVRRLRERVAELEAASRTQLEITND